MFDDMAWPEERASDWEMELMRMRYAEAPRRGVEEPMALSPDPFYLPPTANTTTLQAPPFSQPQPQPTLTSSASCPSFTSFYDIDSDDLLRDIPDEEPLGEPLLGAGGFGQPMGMNGNPMHATGGYDYVLQFQQQHQNTSLRQFPHQSAAMSAGADGHMALLQNSRRPLHASASFTSLASMETEYRRRLASKRKKAVSERWNKVQRHKSFDSTTTSVATAPSPATSMEFSTFNSTSTFESTPETHFLEDVRAPRRPSTATDSEMIGFSIDDFPTTFTSDASWPMPPPLSLASGAPFEGFGTSSALPQPSQASNLHSSDQLTDAPADMDQLLLSEQERANVSSLLDAIRDFDSPLPSVQEKPAETSEVKKASPILAGKPRTSVVSQQRSTRSPHMRGIARSDPTKKKDSTPHPSVTQQQPPPLNPQHSTMRERIQRILDKSSSSIDLLASEREYLAKAAQLSAAKSIETAGSLWLLLHASRCTESGCTISGCDVMRRVVRHCRGCDAPLGKCRDPCNDAKAMLLHHATCEGGKTSGKQKEVKCTLCSKVHEIDRTHNALKSRPPLSPQMNAHTSPKLMPMPPIPVPGTSPIGLPLLLAPQPAFMPSTMKSPSTGSKHVPIQPNPLPTASNPLGMMGPFPHFGCSLAMYLEQTSPAFRAEVKARVEKRVTTAAGQDLIQHMQKKTRLRSLEDLRAEACAIVLGEMERELQLHMQAVNWATVANGGDSNPPSFSSPPKSESGLPAYLLSVAAAGFAAFYAQQATLQAAMAGVATPSFGAKASTPRHPLPRQSSTGNLASAALPLAPKRSLSSPAQASPSVTPKESLPPSDSGKEAALAV